MFHVVKVSPVGEGASWAFDLGAGGATGWTNVTSLAEVSFVRRHAQVGAVELRRA